MGKLGPWTRIFVFLVFAAATAITVQAADGNFYGQRFGSSPRGTGANAVNVGVGTATPSEPLEVVGNVKLTGVGNALIFPDGSSQTTATLQGPQGPQGPPVHTSAACVSLANGFPSCGCRVQTISQQSFSPLYS